MSNYFETRNFLYSGIRNTWINEFDFKAFIRQSERVIGLGIDAPYVRCFDIANIEVNEGKQRQGIFKEWLAYLKTVLPSVAINVIFVECAHTKYLIEYLKREGFKLHRITEGAPSFYLEICNTENTK